MPTRARGTAPFTAAEKTEAKQFVDWVRKGGKITTLKAIEARPVPRLTACAIAENIIGLDEAVRLGLQPEEKSETGGKPDEQ